MRLGRERVEQQTTSAAHPADRMIGVRRATLADKPAIFNFLAKAYGEKARYKFPERWEWQFEKNPFRKPDELPVWIATDETGEIAGQVCAMFEPLKIGTEIHRLGWGVDVIVLPEYRGRKIGLELYEAIVHGGDVFMVLGMTETSRRSVTKLGCVPVDAVAVFRRRARLDTATISAALRVRLKGTWLERTLLRAVLALHLHSAVTALINLDAAVRDLWLIRTRHDDVAIARITRFDHTADEFWDSVSPHFQAIVQRSSEFLNWKYVQQPHVDYQLFSAARGGKMCGYIVLRRTSPPEGDSGIIADLLASPQDDATVTALLAFGLRELTRQRARWIWAASSSDAYKKAFLRLGFKKQDDVTPLFRSNVGAAAAESAVIPGSWFLGRSDHDWDQYA
jgi:hypothetical protein